MARPIKIAQVVFSLEPGGLENGIVNLSNGLDPDRFETMIHCLGVEGGFARRLRPGIGIEAFGRTGGFDRGTVIRLARSLRRDRPDVIHTHNLGPLLYAITARILSGRWSTPILHGEHGALQGDDLEPRRLRQRRWGYRLAREVHTVSESLRRHLLDHGLVSCPITAVINGVDCDRFRPASDRGEAKGALGFEPGDFVIGLVGRFIPSKRHELLLDAFEAMAGSAGGERCRLLLLGDRGPAREAVLDRIAGHPFSDRIRWVGHQDDPLPFYQAMDLQAMPSASEGLSNALLEGMACGVPALAHPACGASEVIDDGVSGWLRAADSPDQLARQLEEVVADPAELARRSTQARLTAESRFSLGAMIGAYAGLFERLASRPG